MTKEHIAHAAKKIAALAGQIERYVKNKKLLSEEIWSDNDYDYDKEKGYMKNEKFT